jgi:tetratricopeptide (TPR) repeat protein
VTVLRATVAPLGGDDPAPDASRALEVVIDKVVSFGGRVEALSRSGVSASFGLDAIEDAPRRGAHAAMAIRKAAERSRRGAGEGFGIRMGLHVEQVLVGQSGSGAEIDADAKGALSAALDALLAVAEPDSIVVSEGAARFLERRFDLVPLAAREAGSAYRLGGTERPGLGLGGRMARFVGRRRELEILQARLPLVLQGHGQVVALVGEPGVGKSRLVWELTHSSAVQDWLRLETGSVSYATAAAYLPVVELLKRYFQVDAGEDGGRVRDRITARMLALDEALEPMLPPLLALLDVPVEDPRWEALEPSQRRQRTLEAIKRLLLRESRARPVLLVFEDLHWVDAETQAVLDTLAEGLPAARILLCVTYRPEYRHGWGSKSFYTQVRVDPLPRESAEELFHALLGEDPGLGALKPLLLDWTEGNPLFLEESIRTLLETRALVGDRGACRLVKPVPSIQVPATVEAVLAARIDRLSGEDKHLLQCAAVIGTDVPFPLLQAVADLPEEALRRGLARLQAAEFLYEAGVFPKVEYTFRHALTHEVAYGSLLPERRRALHHRIVQALEALAPERAMEQVDALASHALRGEVWDKALLYLRQAGARALGRSANREAAVCFEQALGALGRLPESRERLEQAIDLRFDLRTSLLPLGDHERIFAYLHEAEERATALGDQRRLGRVCTYLTNYFFIAGDQDRALRYGHRALTIAAPLDDVALQVEAELRLGQVHHALGEYRRAVEILTGPVEALAGDLLYERFGLPLIFSVGCRTLLSRSLAELGRFDEGVARGEEAVRIAETVPHPFSLTVAYWGIGHVHLRRGDLEQAVAVLERGLELCRDWSIPVWFPRLASTLGSALVLSGRVAEALPLLEQALEQKLPMRAAGDQSWSLASLSEGYLAAGRPSDAARLAEQARGLARAQRDRGTEAWVERLRGEIAARGAPPDPEAAEGAFRRGLELAEALGMRPLLAHCHLGLARAWAGAGRRAEAEPHRAAAAALYREMAMRLWLAECERL